MLKKTTFRLSLVIVLAGFFLWSVNYLPVVMKISSSPDAAEITINGTARGTAPFYAFLLPGEHHIEGGVNHKDGVYYYAASQIQVDKSLLQNTEIKLPKYEFRSPTLGAAFMYIAPGEITNIPYLAEYRQGEKYDLTISQGFFIQATEVTQEQWNKIMGGGKPPAPAADCPGCPPTATGNPLQVANCPGCPVVLVSWHAVQEFIANLNKAEQTSKYRLPTAVEWEYSARAGNCLESQTAPPVTNPIPLGLYDMRGSVWEWTHDLDSVSKIAIGGIGDRTTDNCGSVSLVGYAPEDGFTDVGFRLIREDN